MVVFAPPSKYFAQVCGSFKGMLSRIGTVVSLTKGLCETTNRRMTEIASDILGSMEMVAEGVWNSKVVHELSRNNWGDTLKRVIISLVNRVVL